MKSIDWGLTATAVAPLSEIVSGENPPATVNFHARSRAVSVCALDPVIGAPQPPHVTYENMGLRIASPSLRPICGNVLGSAHAGAVDHGTSKERELSSESFGSHESTQRFGSAGSCDACTWCSRPRLCCPTAIHSPPALTLNAAWLWKQHVISFRNVGLFGLPGSTVRFAVVSS